MNNLQILIYYIATYIMLVPLCPALYKYNKIPPVLKFGSWYMIVVTIKQLLINISSYQGKNIFPPFHIGNVLEASALLLLFREIFRKYDEAKGIYVYRKIFIVLIALFVLFSVTNAVCWQPVTEYPTYTRTVLSIMVVLFSVGYYVRIIKSATKHYYLLGMSEAISDDDDIDVPAFNMFRSPVFWIVTGLLLFYGFGLMRSLFITKWLKSTPIEMFRDFETAHHIFVIMLYTFMLIGFIKAKRMNKKEFSGEGRYKL